MRQLKITKSITNRESVSLEKYLHEIGKEGLITAEEEGKLAVRIRQGDQAALDKLTKANLRFVVSVAKQYQNGGLSLSDMINEGNLGLIKAAKRFDETRGFKFISYAVWWIRQSIMQAMADHSRLVRLPLNQVGTLNRISKATSTLEQEYQREATSAELSKMLDISETSIMNYARMDGRQVSFDAPFVLGETNNLLDVLINTDAPIADNSLMHESLQQEIERSLGTLPEREKEVLRLFFGIGRSHALTLQEIALTFDITRERVRQIKEKAIRRLRHKSRSQLLKTYLG